MDVVSKTMTKQYNIEIFGQRHKMPIVRVATFFREIGRSDSKIHMLMSEVVNKLFVEGFVKKTSTS